jgi:hypothetical protein
MRFVYKLIALGNRSAKGRPAGMVRILCPPAAATSTARFTCCCAFDLLEIEVLLSGTDVGPKLSERIGSKGMSPRRK